MTQTPVSVVVVSRHRPDYLRSTLQALRFQVGITFEVIVVCDPETAKTLDGASIKRVILDEANISKARNLGIAQAACEIIAFIDDDAIPEPTWLTRLSAPFSNSKVAAAGGFVRGRNGISFQWKAEEINDDGSGAPINVDTATILGATSDQPIKTQGTNCAFRRSVLHELQGFDESFRFFLDETDLNVRLRQSGHLTAIVPDAEVQHGYAASAQRGSDRRPKSVFEIAASQSYYLQKHGVPENRLNGFKTHQRNRIERAFVAGLLEPRDVRRLNRELEQGVTDGAARNPINPWEWPSPPQFKAYLEQPSQSDHRYLCARFFHRGEAYEQARVHSENGIGCTVLKFSPSALFHRRYFHRDGFWVQSGGIFGKSTRSDRFFKWYTPSARLNREQKLLARTR